jgi:phosphate:Na+ symporter
MWDSRQTSSWRWIPRKAAIIIVGSALGALLFGWFGEGERSAAGVPRVNVAAAAESQVSTPAIEKNGHEPAPAAQNVDPVARGHAAPAATQQASLDWFTMSMSAMAGLVLFIFGVSQLAQGLGDLNSDRMRQWTARFTSNRVAGVATGLVATTLLESSSVTIIMVIAMVSGGVLTFVQSLGVVLGANIGTAVGAQIIALDIERYVPLLMLSGLLLLYAGKSHTMKKLGIIVLGFGLMFYGLEAIDDAMKPLRHYEPFMRAMKTLGESPVLGAAFGAIFTVIIQSSSAAIAIVITLAGSGLMTLPTGIAIMLGAEIGTCADTLVATIGRGRPALRTGIFHLVFNLACACVGVALAPAFVELVRGISGGSSIGRQIAHAQMIFNCAGVALALPFLPGLARLLERWIPDSERADTREAVPAQ